MSNSLAKSVTPIVLEPGASRRVRVITIAGFLLALFSMVVLPLSLFWIIPGILLLCAAVIHAWQHHHALNGCAVTIRLDGNGDWHWLQDGQAERVELLGDSYHTPFLVILNFKPLGKRLPRRSLLLTTDNIDSDTFRRLRVHLKWQESTNPIA